MLARANRVVLGDDYRAIVRRGRRAAAESAVVYCARGAGASRFGFIVAKSVGNAVVRNRVRRRLKAIAFARLRLQPSGVHVVIRALPGSAAATWDTLSSQVSDALDRGTRA